MFSRFGHRKKQQHHPAEDPIQHQQQVFIPYVSTSTPNSPQPSTFRYSQQQQQHDQSLHQRRLGVEPAILELPEKPPQRTSRVLVSENVVADECRPNLPPRNQTRKKTPSSTTSSNSTLGNHPASPSNRSRREVSTTTEQKQQFGKQQQFDNPSFKISSRLDEVGSRLDNLEAEFQRFRVSEEKDKEVNLLRERIEKLERIGCDHRLAALERENSILHQELLQAGRFTDELASQIIQNALIQKNISEESRYLRERLSEVERVNQQLTTALVTLLTQSVDHSYLQDQSINRSSNSNADKDTGKVNALQRAMSRLSGESYTYSQCPPVMCRPSNNSSPNKTTAATASNNYYTLDFTTNQTATVTKDDGYSSMSCDNTATQVPRKAASEECQSSSTRKKTHSDSSVLRSSLDAIITAMSKKNDVPELASKSHCTSSSTVQATQQTDMEEDRATSLQRTFYDQTVVNLTASVESTLTWPVLDLETFLSAKDLLEKHRRRLNHHSVCSDSELLTDRFIILSDADDQSTDSPLSDKSPPDSLRESPSEKQQPPPINIQRKRFTRKKKSTSERDSLTESHSSSDLTPPKQQPPPKPPRKTPYQAPSQHSNHSYTYQVTHVDDPLPLITHNNNYTKVPDYNVAGVTLMKYPSADDLYIDDGFDTQPVIGDKWNYCEPSTYDEETSIDDDEVDKQFLDEIRRYQLPHSSLS